MTPQTPGDSPGRPAPQNEPRGAALPVVMHFPAPYWPGESRPYQLSQHLARHRRVIYVAADDAPRDPHLRRLMPRSQIAGRVGDVELVTQRLSRGYEGLRRRNQKAAAFLNDRSLDQVLRSLGVSSHWTYTIGAFGDWAADRSDALRGVEIIDPIFEGDPEAAWRSITRVTESADLLLATATALSDELQRRGQRAEMLPNAVSSSLVLDSEADLPPAADPPTAVYVGTVDWRFDADLVDRVATLLPNWRFVIAGRINHDMAHAVAPLTGHPHIEMTGSISEDQKKALLRTARVGLVPFALGRVADGVNPTKVYEYAAYGLPIVATASQACTELSPPVRVATTPDEFAEAIERCGSGRRPSVQSLSFARSNTWSDRAERLHELMSDREARRR